MNVLFVCTGNICRSPLAKQMLDQMLLSSSQSNHMQTNDGRASQVVTDSAGTHAMSGDEMNLGSVRAMTGLGYSPQPHTAKQLTKQLVEWSDLVLTSTEQQRTDVVELHVRANRYTFTLLEFANLAANYQGAPVGIDARLADTISHRGMVPQLSVLDIADPYGRDSAAFERMAAQTKTALEQVVAWLP
jgi:protein-tyrosine phosphatase